jgi:hypothetical protein
MGEKASIRKRAAACATTDLSPPPRSVCRPAARPWCSSGHDELRRVDTIDAGIARRRDPSKVTAYWKPAPVELDRATSLQSTVSSRFT